MPFLADTSAAVNKVCAVGPTVNQAKTGPNPQRSIAEAEFHCLYVCKARPQRPGSRHRRILEFACLTDLAGRATRNSMGYAGTEAPVTNTSSHWP